MGGNALSIKLSERIHKEFSESAHMFCFRADTSNVLVHLATSSHPPLHVAIAARSMGLASNASGIFSRKISRCFVMGNIESHLLDLYDSPTMHPLPARGMTDITQPIPCHTLVIRRFLPASRKLVEDRHQREYCS